MRENGGLMVKTGGRGMDDLPKCGGGNLAGMSKAVAGLIIFRNTLRILMRQYYAFAGNRQVMRRRASAVVRGSPKAVNRSQCSPIEPKPAPGAQTTPHSRSRR